MPNNLGRDQLWTTDIWADLDKAVLDEVGRIRVVQKVFNAENMPNASNVPADEFNPQQMAIAEGRTKPFMEISVDFSLTQAQVDNESTLHTGRTLARLAAKALALAEDALILQGDDAELPETPRVRVINRDSTGDGLYGEGEHEHPIPVVLGGAKGNINGANLFAAVTKGIAQLTAAGQPGPFALLLESSVYADAFAPLPSTLVTTADRLTPLLTGGFYGTGALPENTGLLISLGGEPTTIYVAQDAITAYTQEDANGNYRFRVFERVQFVARERGAFVNFHFDRAAKELQFAESA